MSHLSDWDHGSEWGRDQASLRASRLFHRERTGNESSDGAEYKYPTRRDVRRIHISARITENEEEEEEDMGIR